MNDLAISLVMLIFNEYITGNEDDKSFNKENWIIQQTPDVF